jgi:PEP-CTERM motif
VINSNDLAVVNN